MSSSIVSFNFVAQSVRIVMRNDEPWFVAADVCSALEIVNTARALDRLDDDEKGVHSMNTPGGNQELSIINESGLYSLILTSRKPEAKKFKKWVTSEVLPAIRKHGRYETAHANPPLLPIHEPISPAYYRQLQELVRHIGAHCHCHGKARGAVWARLRHDYDADSVLRLPVESFESARSLLTDLRLQSQAFFKEQMRREDLFINEVIRRGSRLQLVLPMLPTARN